MSRNLQMESAHMQTSDFPSDFCAFSRLSWVWTYLISSGTSTFGRTRWFLITLCFSASIDIFIDSMPSVCQVNKTQIYLDFPDSVMLVMCCFAH